MHGIETPVAIVIVEIGVERLPVHIHPFGKLLARRPD